MSAATAGLFVDIDYIRVWSDDPPDSGVTPSLTSTSVNQMITPSKPEDSYEFKNAQSILLTLSDIISST